jgi:hypothetical protein
VRSNLDELMFALNEHVTKAGTPLLDATFLGTLQLPSHRFLLESCVDVCHPSPALVVAMTHIGNAWVNKKSSLKVTDALRLLSGLREAAQQMAPHEMRCHCSNTKHDWHKPPRSPREICEGAEINLRRAIDNWITERDRGHENE